MSQTSPLGFVGLGVMGEPMCRNLAAKSGRTLLAFDRAAEPLARVVTHGVQAAASIAALAAVCDTLFICLPSGAHVADVATEAFIAGGCLRRIVDMGTSPVALTRDLAARAAAVGITWTDAPIARTRQAAEDGTLSVMVGATAADYAALLPLLACMASDITLCGPVGCGQAVKILNNMVLVETVAALAEAMAIGRSVGLDAQVLLETLAKGSADSFALRNHGMKAMLPGVFPERAFSVEYARKDITYALELAQAGGTDAAGAERGAALLDAAKAAGWGAQYWPVIARVLAPLAVDNPAADA